jgi:hypothetical protein
MALDPGANPTIVSYNISVVETPRVAYIWRFLNKNNFFHIEKAL